MGKVFRTWVWHVKATKTNESKDFESFKVLGDDLSDAIDVASSYLLSREMSEYTIVDLRRDTEVQGTR